jgi:hypothetical protein
MNFNECFFDKENENDVELCGVLERFIFRSGGGIAFAFFTVAIATIQDILEMTLISSKIGVRNEENICMSAAMIACNEMVKSLCYQTDAFESVLKHGIESTMSHSNETLFYPGYRFADSI